MPHILNLPGPTMTRLVTSASILLFASAAPLACDIEPLAVGSASRSGVLTPQAASVKAESDIQSLVDAQAAAWAAKDATAFAATFAPDAKFFNPIGGVREGREAIRAQHAFLFAGPFAGRLMRQSSSTSDS